MGKVVTLVDINSSLDSILDTVLDTSERHGAELLIFLIGFALMLKNEQNLMVLS